MLAFSSGFKGLGLVARDGPIGEIADCFFDDDSREIRWLVIDTGTWLTGRRVLLPASHLSFDTSASSVRVDLTRQQVKDSPHADSHRPVSRQMETSIYGYYNWAPYWGAPALVPGYGEPAHLGLVAPAAAEVAKAELGRRAEDDPNLRSADEVVGYYIQARDGPLGHIEDLLISTGPWFVAAFAIDTRNWWPGRKVILTSEVLAGISWGERFVELRCSRDQIREAPEYDVRQFDLSA